QSRSHRADVLRRGGARRARAAHAGSYASRARPGSQTSRRGALSAELTLSTHMHQPLLFRRSPDSSRRARFGAHAWPERSRAALEADLRAAVEGEVRFDAGSRALYATDGSNYRQVPLGVVLPRDADDVVATVRVCRGHGA